MIRALMLAGLMATTAAAAETERYRIDVVDGGRRARLIVSRGAVETKWVIVCSDADGTPTSRSTRAGIAPAEVGWVMGEDLGGRGGKFTLAMPPNRPLFMAWMTGCPAAGVPTIRRLPRLVEGIAGADNGTGR